MDEYTYGPPLIIQVLRWIESFLAAYGWQLLATVGAALFGFGATQRAKAWFAHPPGWLLGITSGVGTWVMSFACWYKASTDVIGALIVATMMGVLQPLVIWGLFALTRRFCPGCYRSLRGRKKPAPTTGTGADDSKDPTTFVPPWNGR